MLSEKEKLDSLAALGIELNQINDLDLLMERILFKARSFVNADAGSVYIKEEDNLLFTYTQNDTLQMRLQKGENLIYSTFSIPIDETSIAGYVAATGKALNLPNVNKIDPTKPYQFSRKIDEASQYTTKSVLTVPLKTQQKNILGCWAYRVGIDSGDGLYHLESLRHLPSLIENRGSKQKECSGHHGIHNHGEKCIHIHHLDPSLRSFTPLLTLPPRACESGIAFLYTPVVIGENLISSHTG